MAKECQKNCLNAPGAEAASRVSVWPACASECAKSAGTSTCNPAHKAPASEYRFRSHLRHSHKNNAQSIRRMRSGEVRTAGLLRRLEFHQFNSREVGIVNVELPLSVFAHLRLFGAVWLPAVRLQNRLSFFHIRDAQRDVIHHSRQP